MKYTPTINLIPGREIVIGGIRFKIVMNLDMMMLNRLKKLHYSHLLHQTRQILFINELVYYIIDDCENWCSLCNTDS